MIVLYCIYAFWVVITHEIQLRSTTSTAGPQIRYLRTAIFDPRQSQPGGSPIDMLVVHRPGTAIKAAKAASQI